MRCVRLQVLIICVCSLLLVQPGCSNKGSSKADIDTNRINIAAGIPPIADFCRRIGGNKVNVRLLVPAGASPHVYQPTSEDMRYVAKADMLVLNGFGIEFWADKLVSTAENPNLTVVDLSKNSEIAKSVLQDDISHEHGGKLLGNPHVWLDPMLAKIQARTICQQLCEKDPANAEYYKKNLSALEEEIDRLDKSIRARLTGLKSRDFVTFHPAWTYFAKRYNLNQVAAIEEFPGKEPTSDNLKHIIDQIKRLHVRVVFAEPQFSPQIAETIARDAGAKVVIIDPLQCGSDWDYIKMMNTAVDQMVEAFK